MVELTINMNITWTTRGNIEVSSTNPWRDWSLTVSSDSLPHLSVSRTRKITDPGILSLLNTLTGCCLSDVVVFSVAVAVVVVDEDSGARYTHV